MKAKIIVTPKKAVLDPQGKTVQHTLQQMGYEGIGAVHVGKYLEIELPDGDQEGWRKRIDEACHAMFRRHLESTDRRPREYSTNLLLVAQAFERAGDHAKNLAEELLHLVEGRSVRHESKRRRPEG